MACSRKHISVSTAAELPYPTCGDDASAGDVIVQGRMRSGPIMREKDVVESFEITKKSCETVFTARQEWSLEAADVEVIYDESLRPIRAWKRMTVPGSSRPDGNADIRSYELRAADVTIKRRTPDGAVAYELLKPGGKTMVAAGAKPVAVVGPGRGLLTMWIQRAKLAVGGRTRDLVLDFRAMVETLEEQTLTRDEDRFEPSLGKTVRVYTIYGHDTVFADDDDVVIGDLAGLRPSASLTTRVPPPLSTFGGADPAHTP